MFVFVQRETAREHNRLLLAGVVYVVVIAALIALCTATYQKVFQSVTWVTVEADRAGLQLPKFGDVRMHGVLIGQVRDISQSGGHARIKLGLEPEAAKAVPTNARVQIRPTTLFGQKYVEFVDPAARGPLGLRDGTVISADRVQTTVELEKILARLSTLLTTVRPEQLNATLNAVATALTGNGDDIGDSAQKLDRYLNVMEPHLPTLRKDLAQLADVSHTYSVAAPDIIKVLENGTVTARTLRDQSDDFGDLLRSVTGAAKSGTTLLTENQKGLELEGRLAVPLLKLLAHWSPEFTCIFIGLDKTTPGLNQVFHKGRVNQTMSFGGTQRPAYRPIDRPVWGDTWRQPECLGLPNVAIPGKPLYHDGTEDNPDQHIHQELGP
ncbi:MAG TPA: MCE family protein [Aeromicrobium sp.]|nr:MCE family protein [Aeromicrobium sp.]